MTHRPETAGPDRSRPPAPGPLRPSHFPGVARDELANGVSLYIAPQRDLPVVTLSVLLEAGGIHEAPEHAGLARLTSNLLESGAGSRSGVEISDDLEALGVQFGVGAGWEMIEVTVTGLPERIAPAMEIIQEMIRAPTLPVDEVERLRDQQLAGILQRRADPGSLANEMVSRFIFSESSTFSRPLSGSRSTVQSLTRAHVTEFHDEAFGPASTSMLVVGELTGRAAEDLAGTAFGDWAQKPRTSPAVVSESHPDGPRVVVLDRPGAVQSEIRVGHTGVERTRPEFYAIRVMNTILGGAFSSRLNLNLRERHGFTYGVSSGFVMRRVPGPFLVSTAVQTEVTGAALREIFSELNGIREREITDAELSDARNYIAGTFPLGLQTTDGIANRLRQIATYDLPLDYYEGYRDRILGVKREEVTQAARNWVRPDEAVIVIVGDGAQVRAQIEELGLGLGPVQVIDPEELS